VPLIATVYSSFSFLCAATASIVNVTSAGSRLANASSGSVGASISISSVTGSSAISDSVHSSVRIV